MTAIAWFYNLVFYQPLLNLLVLLYNTIAFENFGLAVIFLTVAIRTLLFPLFHKSVRHQMVMQRIQPKLEKIQKEHKDDKEKQLKATMALYQEHEINPFSGIFLLLLQLPVLIALYGIFLRSMTPETLHGLYPFVHAPKTLNYSFFGLINLSRPNIIMVGIAAVLQYVQGKMNLPKKAPGESPSSAERMTRQMIYIAPAITFVIFLNMPAAIGLYWVITSLFSIAQQEIVNRQLKPIHENPGNIRTKTDRTDGLR